jgi:hypothetical protein
MILEATGFEVILNELTGVGVGVGVGVERCHFGLSLTAVK